MLFVTYPSKNISLNMATKGGRNMQEVCDVCSTINSCIIICTFWLYSHDEFLYDKTNQMH
jgi:hypothetical protein